MRFQIPNTSFIQEKDLLNFENWNQGGLQVQEKFIRPLSSRGEVGLSRPLPSCFNSKFNDKDATTKWQESLFPSLPARKEQIREHQWHQRRAQTTTEVCTPATSASWVNVVTLSASMKVPDYFSNESTSIFFGFARLMKDLPLSQVLRTQPGLDVLSGLKNTYFSPNYSTTFETTDVNQK